MSVLSFFVLHQVVFLLLGQNDLYTLHVFIAAMAAPKYRKLGHGLVQVGNTSESCLVQAAGEGVILLVQSVELKDQDQTVQRISHWRNIWHVVLRLGHRQAGPPDRRRLCNCVSHLGNRAGYCGTRQNTHGNVLDDDCWPWCCGIWSWR